MIDHRDKTNRFKRYKLTLRHVIQEVLYQMRVLNLSAQNLRKIFKKELKNTKALQKINFFIS